AAVCVGHEGAVAANTTPYSGDNLFRAAWPLVSVVSAHAADADLERAVTRRVPQPREPLRLVVRGDIAAHAGAVHRDRFRPLRPQPSAPSSARTRTRVTAFVP